MSPLQVQNQIYLLDFQKLEGDPFAFMSLCSQVCIGLMFAAKEQLAHHRYSEPKFVLPASGESGRRMCTTVEQIVLHVFVLFFGLAFFTRVLAALLEVGGVLHMAWVPASSAPQVSPASAEFHARRFCLHKFSLIYRISINSGLVV